MDGVSAVAPFDGQMSPNDAFPDALLLGRYYLGEATADECQAIERWLAQHPGERASLEAIAFGAAAAHGPVPPYDHHARVASVVDHSIRAARRTRRPATPITHRRPSGIVRTVRYALYAAACVAMGWGVVSTIRPHRTVNRVVPKVYATQDGMFATIHLPDGGEIRLAPRTQLTLSYDSLRSRRVASLVGEANFQVNANARVPFVVRVGGVTTRVLGTTFSIRRYNGELVGRVSVRSGRVASQGRGAPVVLDAGMTAQFTDSLVALADATPDVYTDWDSHRLVFRMASVPVVLATLSKWYGYEFRLTDSLLAKQHLSAVFPMGDATSMLNFVQHVLDVRMTFRDSVVTLSPNSGPPLSKSKLPHTQDPVFSSLTEAGR